MKRFLVAGMHRSGTSTVARIAHIIGFDLGPAGELKPSAEDNSEGFWENQRITEFNERVLESAGGSWDRPPIFDLYADSTQAEAVRHEAADLIASVFDDSPVAGWKDPRNSLLGWLWEPMVDGALVCLRDPRAVASSLARRNGLSPEQSHRLWIRYTLDAVSLDKPLMLITLDSLVGDVETSVGKMAEFFGLDQPTGKQMDEITSHLAATGARQGPSPGGANPDAWETTAVGLCQRLSHGETIPAEESEALVMWASRTSWRAAVQRLQEQVLQAQEQVLQGQRRSEEIQRELEAALAREQELLADLERVREDLQRLAEAVEDRERRLGRLELDTTLDTERLHMLREALGEEGFWELLQG